jgi:hypothetical protein
MAYLYLAMRLRRWLRRRVGRKAGNFIGKLVILVLGGPPLLFAILVLLLIRLTLMLLSKLDELRRQGA